MDLGVGGSVLEQVQDVTARLLGPTTGHGVVLLALSLVANAAGVAASKKESVRHTSGCFAQV